MRKFSLFSYSFFILFFSFEVIGNTTDDTKITNDKEDILYFIEILSNPSNLNEIYKIPLDDVDKESEAIDLATDSYFYDVSDRTTAVGYQALNNGSSAGNDNTATGYQALYVVNGSGYRNTAMGSLAGSSITDGDNNDAFGY